ncbi:MAG: hypothetical protein H0X24_25315, partial [Ktedonobacterales bacterium]|nr:hypothetical protein [Ktedonobacterales bacterium]
MTLDASRNGFHPVEPAEQLDAIITDLAADQRPRLLTQDVELVELARLAGTIRGALSTDAGPSADFARNLQARLEGELWGDAPAPPAELAHPLLPPAGKARSRPSRRQLMRGGLVAAAGIAAGLVAGVEVGEHLAGTSSASGKWEQPLVGKGGTWLTVAQVSA